MSYTRLEASDFVVSSDSVTAPAWSTFIPNLTTFYTASTGNNYYLDVYQVAASSTNAAVQFSIAYGHYLGYGAAPINSLVTANTPSRVNYGQYRNIAYGDNESRFNFKTGNTASADMIAIQIDRNRYKEAIYEGSLNLTLKNSTTYLKLTDDSLDTSVVSYLDCGRVYNIVSGSNGTAANSPYLTGAAQRGFTSSGSYGLFLPDVGLIILNPVALELSAANGGIGASFIRTQGTSVNSQTNAKNVYEYIKGGGSFSLSSYETISSNYLFLRVKNGDYNYSTNPSYITGSGNLAFSNFIYNSQTYITTVGLYNDNNELLAVAKMSKPLPKDFTKESLIRVKLDW